MTMTRLRRLVTLSARPLLRPLLLLPLYVAAGLVAVLRDWAGGAEGR